MKQWPALVLAGSMLLVVAAGNHLVTQLPLWHEIVSALPANAGEACRDHLSVISSSRPHWSLCAGDQALPIMATPYASGIAAWPLALLHGWHGGDPFKLRAIWMVIAALSLLLTFRLVRRVQDPATAALASLMVAASAPFLVINALLLPYETLPCTLMVAALSAWATVADPAPRRLRLYAGALLAGLSVASNVKALFLLGPVMAVAWRAGVRPRAIGRAQAFAMLGLFLLPALPMAIFAVIDPQQGFVNQIGIRGGYIAQNLRLGRFVSEPLLLFNFAADTGSILDLAQGRSLHWGLVHFVVGVPILYCMVVGAARLLGRPWGSPFAGTCGAIVLALFLASILLYRQYPGGNYAPLHDVLGLAMAAGIVDLARRFFGKRWMAPAAVVIVALAALSLALTMRRDFRRSVAFSINAEALRTVASHLRTHEGPPLVVTTTYNLAGVVEALGGGRVHEAKAYEAFTNCERARDLEGCIAGVWRKLLAVPLPVRVLVPTSTVPVDKPVEVTKRIERVLTSAELGYNVKLEDQFSTAEGLPVLALYLVSAR